MSILKDDVKATLSTKEGRSTIMQIMLMAGWGSTANYVPGDAQATAFHCGERRVADYIQGMIMDVGPDFLAQMVKEREELRQQHQQAMAQAAAAMQQVKVAVK